MSLFLLQLLMLVVWYAIPTLPMLLVFAPAIVGAGVLAVLMAFIITAVLRD